MKMNINMKKIVFFLLVQFVTLGAFAQEATIKEAEVAYTKEDYGKAIELYRLLTCQLQIETDIPVSRIQQQSPLVIQDGRGNLVLLIIGIP